MIQFADEAVITVSSGTDASHSAGKNTFPTADQTVATVAAVETLSFVLNAICEHWLIFAFIPS